MDTDLSVEKVEINPSDVAKSMAGSSRATAAETFDVAPTKTKKTKKKSRREQEPQPA